MENFSRFFGITTPIEVVNPTSSVDKFYGPYESKDEGLIQMLLMGKPGRIYGVKTDKGTDIYVYEGADKEPTLITSYLNSGTFSISSDDKSIQIKHFKTEDRYDISISDKTELFTFLLSKIDVINGNMDIIPAAPLDYIKKVHFDGVLLSHETDYSIVNGNTIRILRLPKLYVKSDNHEIVIEGGFSNNDAIWDGQRWWNEPPMPSKTARINAQPMFLELECYNLKVNNNITFPSGSNITVHGSVNVSDGCILTLEHGATLVQVNSDTATNTGIVKVKRRSAPMMRNDMCHWGSPVEGQYIRAFSPKTLYNRIWTYNEATSLYKTVFSSNTAPDVLFQKSIGYALRDSFDITATHNEPYNGEFIGRLWDGTIEFNLKRQKDGFNLVGNPYPCSLAVDGSNGIFSLNPDLKYIFVWIPAFKTTSASFNNNYIKIYRDSTVGPAESQWRYIPTGQGFFIQTGTLDKVRLPTGIKSHHEGYVLTHNQNRLFMRLRYKTWYVSSFTLYLNEDSFKEPVEVVSGLLPLTSFAPKNKEALGYDSYADFKLLPEESSKDFNIFFTVKASDVGAYVIDAIDYEKGFSDGTYGVSLIDTLNNVTTNLLTNSYSFTQSTETSTSDRFILRITRN